MERILFASNRDGQLDVYSMAADGMELSKLTDNPNTDYAPAWSSKSGLIAYVSTDASNRLQVFTMKPDGSSRTQITSGPDGVIAPSWSSDGTLLAFQRFPIQSQPTPVIYIARADGSERRILKEGWLPTFTPDGRLTYTDPAGFLHIMRTDGSNDISLNRRGFGVDCSPDGTRMVFDCDFFDQQICSMRPDGGDLKRLTSSSGVCRSDGPCNSNARWSADGRWLAFHSQRHGDREIYVMTPEGKNQKRITNNSADDAFADWR